jgi:hypothetical protein
MKGVITKERHAELVEAALPRRAIDFTIAVMML